MQISPTYAKRKDLSAALKWKFTVEERIENNARVRAFYRLYRRADDYVGIVSVILALVPIGFCCLCEFWAKKLSDDSYDNAEKIGLVFFATGTLALTYVSAVGGIVFAAALIPFIIWIWFGAVMDEYEKKLRREDEQKKMLVMRKKFT